MRDAEYNVRPLCCVEVASGRLDTALIQEDCIPLSGVRRLWKDALDWWRIYESGQYDFELHTLFVSALSSDLHHHENHTYP